MNKFENLNIKKRNSSLEILRIVAMLLIIMHHMCIGNNFRIFQMPFNGNSIIAAVLGSWGCVGWILFFLIGFWFMLDDKFHFSVVKIIQLAIETSVCSIIAVTMNKFAFHESVTLKAFIKAFLSPVLGTYWFITAYIIVYLLFPFIRKSLHDLKNQSLNILTLIALLLCFVFKSYISTTPIDNVDTVLCIVLVTEWIRRNHEKVNSRAALRIVATLSAITVVIMTFDIYRGNGGGSLLYNIFVNRWSLIQVVIATCIFIITINGVSWHNEGVNFIARYMFGVYIIHATPELASHLWTDLFDLAGYFTKYYFGLYMVGCAILTMLVCLPFSILAMGIIHKFVDIKNKSWSLFNRIDEKINEI